MSHATCRAPAVFPHEKTSLNIFFLKQVQYSRIYRWCLSKYCQVCMQCQYHVLCRNDTCLKQNCRRANIAGLIMNGCFFLQENGGVILKRENPHKYLLYKPTVSQFLVFLASGHRELPTNGALMIYLSGDGCFSTKPQAEDSRSVLLKTPTTFIA